MASVVAHCCSANCTFCDTVSCAAVSLQLIIYPGGFRFIVTLGWIMGKPLTLLFDPLESIVMFLSGMFFLDYE